MKSVQKKAVAKTSDGPLTLAIDIGGSGIKSAILGVDHKPTSEFKRLPTPNPATPKTILDTIAKLPVDARPACKR